MLTLKLGMNAEQYLEPADLKAFGVGSKLLHLQPDGSYKPVRVSSRYFPEYNAALATYFAV
jgi:hypothetical protein